MRSTAGSAFDLARRWGPSRAVGCLRGASRGLVGCQEPKADRPEEEEELALESVWLEGMGDSRPLLESDANLPDCVRLLRMGKRLLLEPARNTNVAPPAHLASFLQSASTHCLHCKALLSAHFE